MSKINTSISNNQISLQKTYDSDQDDLDDNKTVTYLEDLKHLVNEAKDMRLDGQTNPMAEMNLKLREDLTKAFEYYI